MKKNRREEEPVTFWKSAVDMFSALLLVVLMILMLFMLNVLENEEYTDYFSKNSDREETIIDHEEEDITIVNDSDKEDIGSAGGGGDDGGSEDGETSQPEDGIGIGDQDLSKAAVYAVVVDAETGNALEEQGILFELYNAENTRVVLNTYYPEMIRYEQFTTTADGSFYLPEKVNLGTFYFKELTEPVGYDKAEDTSFILEEAYDWSDPYIVYIPVSPSKNTISVQLTDSNTGDGITGASWKVIAEEDIVTVDGTTRAVKGDVVDTIECDENGYGESTELYLGKYKLQQKDIP
ncbi:MAG: SpaA isopeptide-forming pilin-related protein, partial [Lachnospiraceae bacterium]|nr:SpaA isopeptide-forming pilin-related protein [Lachnospiraceae bacterium]